MNSIRRTKESGSMVLELALVLPIFFFLMLCLYGYTVVMRAQSEIEHALVETADSMAMDVYMTEKSNSFNKKGSAPETLTEVVQDLCRTHLTDNHFTSTNDWYSSFLGGSGTARKRFVGFLAGGDDAKADAKLKALGIRKGLNGVIVLATVQGEDMTVTCVYTIQTWFDGWDLGKITQRKSVKVKLWK